MRIKVDKTIRQVVESGLCTGCGTCVGVCPNDSIHMVRDDSKGIYLAQLDEARCNECSLCLETCPGHEVDFKALNLEIFGKGPQDILIGNYLGCHIGHATDYGIRYKAASGGLITTLLIFALEEGIINGAVVTKMSNKSPLEPQPFIATTREEIISASKSKYCPVPANTTLKEILQQSGKFAVVGLPCHIHGIRKAEQASKELKEKLVLHLGIFCSHTPNFWGTELLFKRMKLEKDDIIKLDYRGEGWPGNMKISQKNGGILLPLTNYWSFMGSDFFIPTRCLMCCDQTSELADISFGDAWLPGLSDKVGKSIIVSRTERGEQILQRAQARKLVELYQVTANDVKRSQTQALYFKKKGLDSRLKLFQKRPLFNIDLPKPNFIDYLLSLLPYFGRLVSQNRVSRMLLQHAPRRLLSLYGLALNTIYSRRI